MHVSVYIKIEEEGASITLSPQCCARDFNDLMPTGATATLEAFMIFRSRSPKKLWARGFVTYLVIKNYTWKPS